MKHDQNWIHPNDLPNVPVDADPNFDPEHNERVIRETLEHGEKMQRKRSKEFNEKLKERAHATAMYLKQLEKGSVSAQAYFGRGELARLRGMEVINMLKAGVQKGEKLLYKP